MKLLAAVVMLFVFAPSPQWLTDFSKAQQEASVSHKRYFSISPGLIGAVPASG